MLISLEHSTLNLRHRFLHIVLLVAALALGAWTISALPLGYSVAGVTTVSMLVLLLRWPWLIWPLLALAVPVASGTHISLYTGAEVILLIAIGLWILDGARRGSLEIYSSSVLLPLLIYIAVLSLTLIRSPNLGDALAEVIKWVEFALVIALLPAMVSRKNAIMLSAALVLAGVAQALLGLYQFVFQIGPEWFVLLDRYMRASGSFRQPNPYAGYLGIILPVAFSLAIWAWMDVIPRARRRVAAVAWAFFFTGSFIIIGAGLLASWSRGGWLAAAAALFVVIALRSRKGLAVAVGTAVAVVTAALVGAVSPASLPASLGERVQGMAGILEAENAISQPVTDANFAVIERLAHWVAGYRMWESAPWLGIGPGNYAVVYEGFNLPLWTEPLGHAHNLYINILAETGVIGLAAFFLMWVSFAVWILKFRCVAADPPWSNWCTAMVAAALGSMVYVSIHSIVDVLFVQGIYLTLALLFAILAAGCAGVSTGTVSSSGVQRT